MTAAGSYSLHVEAFHDALAANSALQTFLGVSTAVAAKARIFWYDTEEGYISGMKRPIVAFHLTGFGGTRQGYAGEEDYTGNLVVVMERAHSHTDPGSAKLSIRNLVGQFADALMDTTASGASVGELFSWRIEEGPTKFNTQNEEQEEDLPRDAFWHVRISFTMGATQ